MQKLMQNEHKFFTGLLQEINGKSHAYIASQTSENNYQVFYHKSIILLVGSTTNYTQCNITVCLINYTNKIYDDTSFHSTFSCTFSAQFSFERIIWYTF